jgi:hypothetical protein
MVRRYSLPPEFESVLRLLLQDYGLQLSDSRKIADAVIRMSDFYIAHPEAPTPWKEKWCQIAQLSYFLPLNLLRAQSVFLEAQEREFPLAQGELLDFGSGLGAGSWPWIVNLDGPFVFVERSAEAQRIHQRILEILKPRRKTLWISEREIRAAKNRTALFSYSLTELAKVPDWVQDCDSLIVIEPSTREDGRRLLERRKLWLQQGFSMWAPCPHQEGCPLLDDSKKDWCHDRTGFEIPDWFVDLERHLPMKNATLTFSYLLASRKPASTLGLARTVGDQLVEKGRTRQLICVNSKRQFEIWLHRHGKVPEIPRGILREVRRT